MDKEEIYHDFGEVGYFLTFSKLFSVTSYISSALGSMPNLGFPASPKPYLKRRVKNKTLKGSASFRTCRHHISRDPEDKPDVDQKIDCQVHCCGFLWNQARFRFLFSFTFTCNATPTPWDSLFNMILNVTAFFLLDFISSSFYKTAIIWLLRLLPEAFSAGGQRRQALSVS